MNRDGITADAPARIIPVLLLKGGLLVRSEKFRIHQVIGNPVSTIRRFSDWNVDEIVLLSIGHHDRNDLRRDDLQLNYRGQSLIDVLSAVAPSCRMPLAVGGAIRTLDDIAARLEAGADKVVLNTAALLDPGFVRRAADRFGEQCITVSIDVARGAEGRHFVMRTDAHETTLWDPIAWAREMEERGAGELLLNSVDRDGTGAGMELGLYREIVDATSIPVIVCGGVGSYEDFPASQRATGASAVAAANIFHFQELSYVYAKEACVAAGLPVRPVELGSPLWSREPHYDVAAESARIESRKIRAHSSIASPALDQAEASAGPATTWCTECVYPALSAVPLEFDADGVCTGCQMSKVKMAIPDSEWSRRRDRLSELCAQARAGHESYDCIVAVSGGKDSYFQVHYITQELGLRPLLVTYDGNNWTEPGWRNAIRMREVFDVDHLFVRPSVRVLKALNRLAFYAMGDMNWHAHVGIMTVPMMAAVRFGVPLVFYGEHGYADLGGQFSWDDYPEVTYRDRLEHFARGFEWTYFVGREGLTAQDLEIWKYPRDESIYKLGLRGIFLGNYVKWEANEHGQDMMRRYGFESSDQPFDRTYRTMSNLDDMHENGVHDYLKYIKFGYGRATDHACKDIRAGMISRDQAIDLVRKYDPVKPSDLQRWLTYVDMTEAEFDAVADTFRDPRVWRHQADGWAKDDIR